MKHQIKLAILAACGALMLAGTIGMTGCASDETHRSTGTVIDDASITSRVKTDLLQDPLVKGTDINVDTYQGEVQLNGFVDSNEQRQVAERIAKSTSGVRSVKNNLQVKPGAAGSQP